MAETESDDLPFRAEYAKSGRAACKMCKDKIDKDDLRLAVMIQSRHFDGKVPNWFHYHCFFSRQKVKAVGDIAHFTSLRWDDQVRLREKIENTSNVAGTSNGSKASGSGSNAKKGKGATSKSEFADFSIEYAKSSRSSCRLCEEKIEKAEVRISKQDYESEKALQFGPHPGWYHVKCFIQERQELEFFGSADQLPGFKTLGVEEQTTIKGQLKKIKNAKRKAEESEVDAPLPKKPAQDDKLKKQNENFYKCRDVLEATLHKKQMIEILEMNEQYIPTGESKLLDHLADLVTFGALVDCSECKDGKFIYSMQGYRCQGNISDWTKCSIVTQTPTRRALEIPDDFLEYSIFQKYKFIKRDRLFQDDLISSKAKSEIDGINKPAKLLDNCNICLIGKLKNKADIVKKLENLGAKVGSKIDANTLFVISTSDEVKKQSKKLLQANVNNIHVVSEDIADSLSSCKKADITPMIQKHSLCTWGGNIAEKVNNSSLKSKKREDTTFTKSMPNKIKMMVKGSAAVDPDSDLDDVAHILEENGSIYNAILGMVDISKGTNSYYKLQLLASDKGSSYWVFRAWGRVGTTIGGKKVEMFPTKLTAIMEFKALYEEKTGNQWENRSNFQKFPNRFYPLEIDYGPGEDAVKDVKLVAGSGSTLSLPVQELICLLFDVELMKSTMLEFEIDLKKMPLGKLSKRQIKKAYEVLTELQDLLKNNGTRPKFLDGSNKFYTLIPHDFGMKKPIILNTEELIKVKIDMLDSLLDIEVAYNLLKSVDKTDDNPVDVHYKQLKTEIDVLEKESDEFKLLNEYTKNTHASTHGQYSLEIDQVYKINRQGESKSYKPFKKLNNRKLLWHGSRLTNFAGILSQGLRIAPPEAPATGYMFGKGIYFADMVSKSANYCCTSPSNPVGLLLLCEVALGNVYQRYHADYITKLPPQMHSTKGVGCTEPDPVVKTVLADGVEIPHGQPVKSSDLNATSLLYNEYIVYDTAQVNIKYLLKTKFNWKY